MQFTMVIAVYRYLFHLREIWMQTLETNLKKGSNFGTRERKYANTRGGGRARGQNSFQIHFYCIPFVFITSYFLLLLLCTFNVATELRITNFTVFRIVIIFVIIFRKLLIF